MNELFAISFFVTIRHFGCEDKYFFLRSNEQCSCKGSTEVFCSSVLFTFNSCTFLCAVDNWATLKFLEIWIILVCRVRLKFPYWLKNFASNIKTHELIIFTSFKRINGPSYLFTTKTKKIWARSVVYIK